MKDEKVRVNIKDINRAISEYHEETIFVHSDDAAISLPTKERVAKGICIANCSGVST